MDLLRISISFDYKWNALFVFCLITNTFNNFFLYVFIVRIFWIWFKKSLFCWLYRNLIKKISNGMEIVFFFFKWTIYGPITNNVHITNNVLLPYISSVSLCNFCSIKTQYFTVPLFTVKDNNLKFHYNIINVFQEEMYIYEQQTKITMKLSHSYMRIIMYMKLTVDEYTISSRKNLLSPAFASNNPQSIFISHAYA